MADAPEAAKQFHMTKNIGNTAEILLNLARSTLPNADKIFNSNPVLRRAVYIDMQAADIKKAVRATVPKLDRDVEIAENILAQFRAAAGTDEDQRSLANLVRQFDTASKKTNTYHAARLQGIDTLLGSIKSAQAILTAMAETAGADNKPVKYAEYLQQLQPIGQEVNASANSFGTLAKDASVVRENLKEVSKSAVDIIRTWPKAKQGQIPGIMTPTPTQEYDSPNPDD